MPTDQHTLVLDQLLCLSVNFQTGITSRSRAKKLTMLASDKFAVLGV